MLLAVVLNYCYGANEDRRPPNPFPGQDPNADCDQLQWHCRMSVSQLLSIDSHGRSTCAVGSANEQACSDDCCMASVSQTQHCQGTSDG